MASQNYTPRLPLEGDLSATESTAPAWSRGLLTSMETCADLTGVPLLTIEEMARRGVVETQLKRGVNLVAVDGVILAAAAAREARS